jgi:hypothetical protein
MSTGRAANRRGFHETRRRQSHSRSSAAIPLRLSSSRSTIYACSRVSNIQPGDITQISFVLGLLGFASAVTQICGVAARQPVERLHAVSVSDS